MEWEFPVFNTHKIVGQRIRNFVANGNVLVLTGGIAALEFINSYFFYNIELVDGNYSPGPFRRLNSVPKQLSFDPKVLPQKGISVTAVKKASLPSGAEVLWGTPRSSPVFRIKFCEAQSPDEGMPPVKVLPRDCPLAAQDGRPCSCGYLVYIGYNWNEPYPSRWDKVLLSSVELLNPCWTPPPPLPPLEPCSDVPKPNCAANSVPSCPATGWSGQGSKKTLAGGAPAASSTILRAVSEEQDQIHALESEVEELASHREAPEHTSTLSALKSKVSQLLGRLDSAPGASRRRHASRGRSEDRVLENSMLSLSSDVRKVDSKVDKLASALDKVEARRRRHD